MRRRLIVLGTVCLALVAGCPDGGGGGGLDPNQFGSLTALVNHALVQAAIAQLNAAGLAFPVYTESTPPNIAGGWDIAGGAVTYDQTGVVNFQLPSGRDTFFNQTGGTIAWTTVRGGTITGASQRGYIRGTSQRFTVGLLIQVSERDVSNTTTLCARQMAFFYSLMPNGAGTQLTGAFLAVTLATTGGVGGTACLQTGDFVYGNITLNEAPDANSAPILALIGTVPTGTRTPTSVALLPDGSAGFIGTSSGSVLYFTTANRVASELALPSPNSFSAAGPVFVSPDGGRVGFVELGDPRILVYGTSSRNLVGNIVAPQSPSPANYPALPVLFRSSGNAAYAGIAFQNHRPGFAFFNSVQGVNPASISSATSFLNDGLRLIHLTQDGGRLVALLNGGAPAGKARFVGVMGAQSGSVEREVDMTSQLGIDILDGALATSTNGATAWLTTGKALQSVSLLTGGISTINVLESTSDNVRNLARSGDGQVLLVSIASGATRGNVAIVDAGTSQVLNRQYVSTLNVQPTSGQVVFFPSTRVGVILSGPSGIDLVPINTLSPYTAGTPVQAAVATNTANTTGVATGGRVLAAANASERAVYLFQLVSP